MSAALELLDSRPVASGGKTMAPAGIRLLAGAGTNDGASVAMQKKPTPKARVRKRAAPERQTQPKRSSGARHLSFEERGARYQTLQELKTAVVFECHDHIFCADKSPDGSRPFISVNDPIVVDMKVLREHVLVDRSGFIADLIADGATKTEAESFVESIENWKPSEDPKPDLHADLVHLPTDEDTGQALEVEARAIVRELRGLFKRATSLVQREDKRKLSLASEEIAVHRRRLQMATWPDAPDDLKAHAAHVEADLAAVVAHLEALRREGRQPPPREPDKLDLRRLLHMDRNDGDHQAVGALREWIKASGTNELVTRTFDRLAAPTKREVIARAAILGEAASTAAPADPRQLAMLNLLNGLWPELRRPVSSYTVADVIAAETKAMRAALSAARRRVPVAGASSNRKAK